MVRICVVGNAVPVLPSAGRTFRSIRPETGDSAFLLWPWVRLHTDGAGAVVELVVCWPANFGNYDVKCFDGVCLHHGRDRTRGAREKIRHARRGFRIG